MSEKGTDSKTIAEAIVKKLPARLAKEYKDVKISIDSDADKIDKICRELNEERTKGKKSLPGKYLACWGPSSGTDLVAARAEIFLFDDVDNVHSNLIPMIIDSYAGLNIDQKVAIVSKKLAANDPGKIAFEFGHLKGVIDSYKVFLEYRMNLATQFTKILENTGESSVNALYKSRFIGDAKASDDELISDVGFQNFVLAEVGESAYCSGKTRKVLSEDRYKKINEAFVPFDEFFKTAE